MLCLARDLQKGQQRAECNLTLVCAHLPFLHPVDLQIDPPYSRYAQYTPQRRLSTRDSDGQPFQEEEIGQEEEQQQRDSARKQEEVEGQVKACRLGRDGKKWGNARSCRSR